MKRLRKWLRKFKFSAKKFVWITILSVVEIILLLWGTGWQYTPAIYAVIIQYFAVFKRKVEELKEDDIKLFIKGIFELFKEGKDADEILEKVKED